MSNEKSADRAVKLQITGRVQKVGFRNAAKEQGKQLGIEVEARNIDDGTVEIVTKGPREAVDKFIMWAHQGPAFANVDSVDVTDIGENRSSRGFA